MTAGSSPEYPIFVLQADEIIAIEVKKLGRALVRDQVLLSDLNSDLFWIVIA